MLMSDEQQRLERFRGFAAAFETAYATDDWTVLEPFLTEDVASELNGARVAGRGPARRRCRARRRSPRRGRPGWRSVARRPRDRRPWPRARAGLHRRPQP